MVENKIEGIGMLDKEVLRAMRAVSRHEFVPAKNLEHAYENRPLSIGYGQTISQPYIVGLMTGLLELQPGDKVLEIGTGSGYQAAILAELADVDIYTIEIIPELADAAAKRLKKLGYEKIHVRQGDGYYGWLEHAPFNAIIVTAAPEHLPEPLVGQLAEDGRIVIPMGPPKVTQRLRKFVKKQGELREHDMGGVIFVPFTGSGIKLHKTDSTP